MLVAASPPLNMFAPLRTYLRLDDFLDDAQLSDSIALSKLFFFCFCYFLTQQKLNYN